MNDLKTCPFCNFQPYDAVLKDDGATCVECPQCHARGPDPSWDMGWKPGDEDVATKLWNLRSDTDILRDFYRDVCAEAESIMALTGTVSGAHYNAMKRILKRKGIEVQP